MTFFCCGDDSLLRYNPRRLLSVLDYSIFFSRLRSTRMKRPHMSLLGGRSVFETLQRSPAGAFLLTMEVPSWRARRTDLCCRRLGSNRVLANKRVCPATQSRDLVGRKSSGQEAKHEIGTRGRLEDTKT